MKLLTSLCLLTTLLALSPALRAQDVDFELVNVGLESVGDQFRLQPQVLLHNRGHLANQILRLAVYYGPILADEMHSDIEYFQDHHTCWDYLAPNCGNGNCFDIYSFGASYYGFCTSSGVFLYCECNYEVEQYFSWDLYTGQPTATVVVDPYDEVQEFDETNNTMTISLEPVAAEESSWSTIKSLYR